MEELSVFKIGNENKAYEKYFVGKSYLNNWHIHHSSSGGGQILMVTAGKGWYQEFGKSPVMLKPGDVVNILPGVKHWHGAAKDSYFQHLAIEVPGKDTKTEWCEPVSDEEYNNLK